jgi:hypothetical protein
MLLAALLLLMAKRAVKCHWRTRGEPAARIENGWKYLMLTLRWHGGAPNVTPGVIRSAPASTAPCRTRREHTRRIVDVLGNRTELSSLTPLLRARLCARLLEACERADAACFSGAAASQTDAAAYWKLLDSIALLMTIGRTRHARWHAALSVAGLCHIPRLPKSSKRMSFGGVRLTRDARRIHEEGP